MKPSLHFTGIFFISALLLLASCQSYYKAINITPQVSSAKVDSLQQSGKYFVLRAADTVVQMKAIAINDEQATLQFSTDTISEAHRLHLVNGCAGKLRYYKHEVNDTGVLKEIHVYAPSLKVMPGEQLKIPLNQVNKVELLSFDKQKTARSKRRTVAFLALGVVTTFVVAVGVAASNMHFDLQWK